MSSFVFQDIETASGLLLDQEVLEQFQFTILLQSTAESIFLGGIEEEAAAFFQKLRHSFKESAVKLRELQKISASARERKVRNDLVKEILVTEIPDVPVDVMDRDSSGLSVDSGLQDGLLADIQTIEVISISGLHTLHQ